MSSDSVPWRRQSSQIGGNGGGGSPGTNSVDGPPPPPPILGHIPSQKLASEIPPMRKEPPAAIQNAMMKDKKPFTYTPGGLDLAEIRSPRMAKRISRNAHMEDSCTPQLQRPQPTGAAQPLPPSALAAMQPQIAIPVFPPGGGFPSQGLPTPPPPPPPPAPSAPSYSSMEPDFPPPPPLPPQGSVSPSAGAVPPPPPPPPPGNLPTSPASNSSPPAEAKPSQQNGLPNKGQPLAFLQDIQNRPQLRSVGPINQSRPPPDFVAEIPVHAPLKPINHPPRSSYDPTSNPNPIAVALKPSASKAAPIQNSAPPFIPQPMSPETAPTVYQQDVQQAPPPPPPPQMHPPSPPVQNQIRSVAPPPLQMHSPSPPAPLNVIQNQIRSVAPPTPGSASPGPQSPMTSNVNKGPAPWMTTRQTSKEPLPPWTSRPSLAEEAETQPLAPQATVQQTHLSQQQSQSNSSQITRVIPIQIEGREPPAPSPTAKVQTPPFLGNTPQMYMTPQQLQYMQQQQFLQQQQQQQFLQQQQQQLHQQQQVNQQHQSPTTQPTFVQQGPSPQQLQGRTRIIPIQIEGTSDDNQQQRVQVQSPVGFAQRSNSTDSTDSPRRPLQTQTSWTGNPTQSRSFRVLQKITGSEDEPTGPFPAPPSETFLVNRVLPPQQAASPVGADNSKCWNPNTPPPMYPNPNYWYYPPQSPEEQQQFWEHYNAMCAYMAQMNAAAYRYSPYPMYPYPYLYPSDNEEYSGYSSSDEMTHYGQMFKKQAEMAQAAKQAQVSAEGAINVGPAPPSIIRESSDSSVNSEVTEKGDSSDAVSETDTEVGEDETKMNSLQSIKSVPNINVYNDSDSQTEESEVSEEEDEETDGETDLPHQLSIIFEESEQSDVEGSKRISLHKEQSQSNDSCATLQSNEDDENDNSTDSTVTVRLPLQFKFSRSSNDEEVATVIVGNSEVESGRTTPVASENLIITDIVREDSDPDVTATICLKKFKKPPPETSSVSDSDKPKCITPSVDASYYNFDDHGSTSDSPVDFWRELSDKENDTSKLNHRAQNETPSQTSEDDSKHDESDYHSSSTSIQTVKKGLSGSENLSGSETENHPHDDVKCHSPERQDSSEDDYEDGKEVKNDERAEKESAEEDQIQDVEGSESSEYESEEDEDVGGNCEMKSVNDEEAVSMKIPAVKKELISKCEKDEEEEEESEEEDETEESERSCSSSSGEDEEEEEEQKHPPKTIVKKETPRQPSKLETHKSQEESEEDDSGVTSDLSRHISETDTDPECGGELRKMTRYQRAATHSRLFKLLQDECKVDEGPEEEPIALSARKERLSLPLQNQYSTEQDSLSSSSGINSPSSPTTTDKLVKELVKSLLSRKKGRHFRKLPLEKLHAAALRILQEDMDPYDTASTSDESNNILSPVASASSNQTNDTIPHVGMANPELYGGNYYDYCNYYSTWGHQDPYGGSEVPDEYEILPSKAFRILQENTQPERYSSPVPKIAFPVRCPRVSHPPLQDPNPPPETNATPIISESTSTSQET